MGADIVCFVPTAVIAVQISLILRSQTEVDESPTLVRVKEITVENTCVAGRRATTSSPQHHLIGSLVPFQNVASSRLNLR